MQYDQTSYPSSPQLTWDMTTDYNKTDGLSPTKRKLTGYNSRKSVFVQTTIPNNMHTDKIFFYKHHTGGRQAQHTKATAGSYPTT